MKVKFQRFTLGILNMTNGMKVNAKKFFDVLRSTWLGKK